MDTDTAHWCVPSILIFVLLWTSMTLGNYCTLNFTHAQVIWTQHLAAAWIVRTDCADDEVYRILETRDTR